MQVCRFKKITRLPPLQEKPYNTEQSILQHLLNLRTQTNLYSNRSLLDPNKEDLETAK